MAVLNLTMKVGSSKENIGEIMKKEFENINLFNIELVKLLFQIYSSQLSKINRKIKLPEEN
jgi:hypothetical protein